MGAGRRRGGDAAPSPTTCAAIAEAIRDGDADAARDRMREHVERNPALRPAADLATPRARRGGAVEEAGTKPVRTISTRGRISRLARRVIASRPAITPISP